MFPTNKKFIEKLGAQIFENAALCAWCGIPFGSANFDCQPVCIRCYKLLMGANLSDAEIFGNERQIKESFPCYILE
jgi:hypothetical protein